MRRDAPRSIDSHCGSLKALDQRVVMLPSMAYEAGKLAVSTDEAEADTGVSACSTQSASCTAAPPSGSSKPSPEQPLANARAAPRSTSFEMMSLGLVAMVMMPLLPPLERSHDRTFTPGCTNPRAHPRGS